MPAKLSTGSDGDYPPAEVFYATADALYSSQSSELSSLIKERLSGLVSEDNVRYLLADEDIKIEFSKTKNSAKITVKNKNLSKKERIEKLEAIKKAMEVADE